MDITAGERELAMKWYEGPGGVGAAAVERMAADFAAERQKAVDQHVKPHLERIQVLETERANLITERDAYKAERDQANVEIARLRTEATGLQERGANLKAALQQVLDTVQAKLKRRDHGIGIVVRAALEPASKTEENRPPA